MFSSDFRAFEALKLEICFCHWLECVERPGSLQMLIPGTTKTATSLNKCLVLKNQVDDERETLKGLCTRWAPTSCKWGYNSRK